MPTSQSIQYTFDMRNSVLTDVAPIDMLYPRTSSGYQHAEQTAGFPLYIPSGIDFEPSSTASGTGLQSWYYINYEKYLAILAANPGFSYIAYDDLEDATGFDMATASGVFAGGRGTFTLGDYGSASTVTTNAVALSGSAPTQAHVWADGGMYIPDLNSGGSQAYSYSDPKDDRCRRYFRPADVDAFLSFDVSFNGGSTWITGVFLNSLINIPLVDQGTSFKLRMTRINLSAPRGRVLLGSWALVY
jgi:hypothetical protein